MAPTPPEPGTLAETDEAPAGNGAETDEALVEEDLLVEEISIDGMCGVY